METNAPQGFFGRLGGLLGPQGLTPEEQAQMGRQGLLQMGLGILANNHDRYNAGAAVGSGLLAGISAMQKSGKDLIDRRTGTTDPATFRAQHMAAIAAGYEPGSEGYQNFFKRANGELARASSAGYSLVKFTGPDGRERIGTMSGQSGIISMPDGSTFDPQASGVQVQEVGAPQAGAFQPPGVPPAGMYDTPNGRVNIGEGLTPEQWQLVQADVANGGASDAYSLPDRNVPTFTPAPVFQRPSATAGVNPFVSRRPEDEAAATERAKLQAQLDYLPQQQAIETQGAIDRAVGTERGKAQVERESAAPGAIETMQQSLTAIDELMNSPDLGSIVGWGSINPLNRLPNSPARGLIARAEQIGGKAFLAAFNQLKGGGAITEREGAAATAAMARLDRSQSLEDYQTALRDLRAAIAPALERQRAVVGGQQQGGGQQGAPVRIQSADDYNRLPSGAIYIAPDGMQRRKR